MVASVNDLTAFAYFLMSAGSSSPAFTVLLFRPFALLRFTSAIHSSALAATNRALAKMYSTITGPSSDNSGDFPLNATAISHTQRLNRVFRLFVAYTFIACTPTALVIRPSNLVAEPT